MAKKSEVEQLLANVGSQQASQAAIAVIDLMQGIPPHIQIAALASSFILLCKRFKVNPAEAFTYVGNLMAFCNRNKDRPEFQAINMYMENELK